MRACSFALATTCLTWRAVSCGMRGEPIALEPQVFDLLAYLIQNRDRVVTKDDLLGSVWGGRIVSEFDADQPDQCGAPGDRR